MILVALASLSLVQAASRPQTPTYIDPYPVESLAVVMGELHAIAFACEGRGSQTWRNAMLELLQHEAPTRGTYRDRLTERFNEGFRSREGRRVRCGAEEELERAALAERGQVLAEQLRRTYLE